MAKKRKHHKQGVLQTLSRLATTVRADAPTVLLRDQGVARVATVKADPANQPARFARLNPFSAQARLDRSARKKVKHLAKQMAARPAVATTSRRSRLPLVVAMLAMLLGGVGYWAHQNISLPRLPDWNLSQYLDHKKWLNLVSGRSAPQGSATLAETDRKKQRHQVKAKGSQRSRGPIVKASKSSGRATKANINAKSNTKKSKTRAIAAENKRFSKLSKAEKERIWKARLAKLKQQSKKKYQKASVEYRHRP